MRGLAFSSAIAIATALGGFQAALAAEPQQAPDATAANQPQQSEGLSDIIVTAQKRAEPLQSVPVSVSAFSNDTLQKARVDGLTGLRGLVPGMTVTRSGAAVDVPQISLRGISIQDVLPSVEPGIGITLDGIPIAFQRGALIDAFDVQRVEVLRGPQGVLNGKNTTGGSINVVRLRPDPSADTTGKVRFTIGSFGQNDYEGYIMAPVVKDILAVKATIAVRKDNGQFRNIVAGGREGDRDVRQYSLAAVATPTDRLNIYVAFDRLENDSAIPPYVATPVPDLIAYPIPGYFGGLNSTCLNPATQIICRPLSDLDQGKNEVETTQLPASLRLTAGTGEISYDLTDEVKFTSLTGYREFHERQTSDFDATRFALFRDKASVDAKQFSQEARFATSFSGPFNIVAGAFYMNYRYTEKQNPSLDAAVLPDMDANGNVILTNGLPTFSTPPGVAFLNSLNRYRTFQTNKTFALFFQADYDITDKLRLTVGGRQTWDKKTTDYSLWAPELSTTRDNDAIGPLVGQVTGRAKFKKFTPKVNLQYKFTPDILAYAQYSKGYNTGGFNGRPGNLVTAVQAYEPETMQAYEIGLKTELFNKRVRLNLSAFHNTLDEKQENVLQVVGTTNVATTLNVAKAQYKGFEAELALAPMRGWTITGSVGYLDAKYKDFFGDLGQGPADLSGLKLRRVPKWTAGAISDYSFAAGPGTVGLNAAIFHTSRYETDVLNDPRGSIPPVTKIDLGVRYELPVAGNTTVELAGFVKNVTNNTTYDGYTSGDAVGTFIEFANPSPGRQWGASLTARF
ncbi:TonB-dependent receptor [Sphingobium sp. Cam5-1]|uniref:TonB-dependent receptor n=1 Tax=Sphingobium sp. Cam5-1 TaxID=2789327 RepID=UPI0018AD2C56|nr:TonB-dependent receptor [Sphingobium sp. Cam5-1]QPI74915.1 TonB-dependent receptor [Sphingobium sp. Cam5-1]